MPVIRDAQELSVEGLAKRIKDLARRARDNQLTPDEVRGGSFTITNPGGYGSIIATPVINQPQVAILDTEAVVKRPVVITDELGNDSIAIRPMTYLCMSWDHRALDGALAAQFLSGLRTTGSSPGRSRRMRELWTCHLGEVEYREAVALQERLRARVQAGELPDLLLLLEHPPVYTLGRRSEPGELPVAQRHPGRRDRARRQADLPRPRPAGRLSDHARAERARVRGDDGARAGRRDPRRRRSRGNARRAASSPASGSRTARSARSASTSRAASRCTASRSTWRTTSARSAP